ncbi:hypothetical protein HMPREF1870_00368 [Bacteroidales bacterium KA00344]|nr:hypothetical protein HMPREF1870_00368 [Bacteroidales bacterium KA00344]
MLWIKFPVVCSNIVLTLLVTKFVFVNHRLFVMSMLAKQQTILIWCRTYMDCFIRLQDG